MKKAEKVDEMEKVLDVLRVYVEKCKQKVSEVKIGTDVTDKIQKLFVDTRKNDKNSKFTPEVLNQSILIAKLIASLDGSVDVTYEMFTKAQEFCMRNLAL